MSIQQHQQCQIDPIQTRPFWVCTHCDFMSRSKSSWKRHIRVQHEGVKYSCSLCPKVIKWSQENLKIHFERKHGVPTVPCDQCDHVANSEQILKSHITQVHEGRYRKKWSCKHCGNTLSSKAARDAHILHRHAGYPRPKRDPEEWGCGLCGKNFSLKHNRDAHVRRVHK